MSETFAEKAQRLVDEGRVEAVHNTSFFTEASVQGDHGYYHPIVYVGGSFFCTCKWGAVHSYSTDLCAHALAVRLAASMTARC